MQEIFVYIILAIPNMVDEALVNIRNIFSGPSNYTIEIVETHSTRKVNDIETSQDALVAIENSESKCSDYHLLSFSSYRSIIIDGSTAAPIGSYNLKKCPLRFAKLPAGSKLKILKYADLKTKKYEYIPTFALQYLIVSDEEGILYDINELDYYKLTGRSGEEYTTKYNLDWNELISNTHKLCMDKIKFDDQFDKYNIKYKLINHPKNINPNNCVWFKFDDVESLKTAVSIYNIRPSSF